MMQVGKGKFSDSADFCVHSLHELPKAIPHLFAARPSAPVENGGSVTENGVSPAVAEQQNGLPVLVTGASLDEADLTIQEALEVRMAVKSRLGHVCKSVTAWLHDSDGPATIQPSKAPTVQCTPLSQCYIRAMPAAALMSALRN